MLSSLSENLGKGLVAGALGTAAMTISSTLEAKVRDRPSSTAPATAASAVLGVSPTEDTQERFSELVHWGYGTSLGAIRGLIATLGLRGKPAIVAHLAAVWAGEQVMLPATGAAPPLSEWGAEEIAIDLLHHSVYALATGLAYSWLDRDPGDRDPGHTGSGT